MNVSETASSCKQRRTGHSSSPAARLASGAKQTHQRRSASAATKASTFPGLPLYYASPRYLCYGKHHNVFSHLCILCLPSLSHSFPRDLNMNSSISLPSQPMNLFKSLLCSAPWPRYSRGRACEVGQFIRRPPLFSLIFSLLVLPEPSSPSSPLPHTRRYGRGDQINILTKVQHPQWSCQCGEKRTHSTYLSPEYIIRRRPSRLHFDYFSLPAREMRREGHAGRGEAGREEKSRPPTNVLILSFLSPRIRVIILTSLFREVFSTRGTRTARVTKIACGFSQVNHKY